MYACANCGVNGHSAASRFCPARPKKEDQEMYYDCLDRLDVNLT